MYVGVVCEVSMVDIRVIHEVVIVNTVVCIHETDCFGSHEPFCKRLLVIFHNINQFQNLNTMFQS